VDEDLNMLRKEPVYADIGNKTAELAMLRGDIQLLTGELKTNRAQLKEPTSR
jgi:hypothetical protein